MTALGVVFSLLVWFLALRYVARRIRASRATRAARLVPRSKARKPVPVDDLFRSGATLNDEARSPLRVVPIATLALPTGRIVACDPLTVSNEIPFARTVAAGRYPVDICFADIGPGHVRVAALRLRFSDDVPVSWEIARFAGDGDVALLDGETVAYGVDAGCGGFVDASAIDRLRTTLESVDERASTGLLAALGAKSWLDYSLGAEEPNVVLCSSGWGDGCYASYWGLDAAGAPACLVTDFAL